MVVVRISREYPVVTNRGRSGHRTRAAGYLQPLPSSWFGGNIHASRGKTKQNMRVRRKIDKNAVAEVLLIRKVPITVFVSNTYGD